MELTQTDSLPILTDEDIVKVRHSVRLRAVEMRFSIVEQTKIVTAASELARNTLIHGGGGKVLISTVERDNSLGIKLEFVDAGQGIQNVKLALTDGYSTGGGMGLGLSGSKRLMSEFELETLPGKGTRVTVIKWKNSLI